MQNLFEKERKSFSVQITKLLHLNDGLYYRCTSFHDAIIYVHNRSAAPHALLYKGTVSESVIVVAFRHLLKSEHSLLCNKSSGSAHFLFESNAEES